MVSVDDFRLVKAIADCRSPAEAAKALRINQSTVIQDLARIEKHLGARLFKRTRAGYALTPRGDEMARLAARITQDVAAFERGADGKTARGKALVTGVVPLDQVMARTGLEFLTAIIDGALPQPPICGTLGFRLAKASDGYARLDGLP